MEDPACDLFFSPILEIREIQMCERKEETKVIGPSWEMLCIKILEELLQLVPKGIDPYLKS